mmetsp:Transcript_16283/g.39949  ORF Transcript_16283/g.39949 Transcript_16283/m.39949 type:complete len:141 (-) Transcript_16283:182-604(-)
MGYHVGCPPVQQKLIRLRSRSGSGHHRKGWCLEDRTLTLVGQPDGMCVYQEQSLCRFQKETIYISWNHEQDGKIFMAEGEAHKLNRVVFSSATGKEKAVHVESSTDFYVGLFQHRGKKKLFCQSVSIIKLVLLAAWLYLE